MRAKVLYLVSPLKSVLFKNPVPPHYNTFHLHYKDPGWLMLLMELFVMQNTQSVTLCRLNAVPFMLVV